MKHLIDLTSTPTTYPVTVDYYQSLKQMITAGRYDLKHRGITTKGFPVNGTGQVEVEFYLVHMKKKMSMWKVLAELDYRGLRPAKIEELLAFGASTPTSSENSRSSPSVPFGGAHSVTWASCTFTTGTAGAA